MTSIDEFATDVLGRAAEISEKMEIDLVALEAARNINEVVGGDICAISQWDREDDTILLLAEYSSDDQQLESEWREPAKLTNYPVMKKVLRTGIPVFIAQDDKSTQKEVKAFLKKIRMQSVYILPLVSQDGVIGVVEVFSRDISMKLTSERAATVRLIAAHTGVVLERTRLLKDAEQKAAELEALRRASLSLTASLDLDQVLPAILENALSILEDALDAHIFLYDGEKLSFGAALWADGNKDKVWADPRPEGLTYRVARSGDAITVPDMRNHPLYADSAEQWSGAIVGLPLKIGPRVVGVMNVAYQNPRQFSIDELRIINLLGDQAALAVENARLHNLVIQQALTDSLTGLPNRRAFDERLEDEIKRSQRYNHHFSLVLVDFDNFKLVNDTFGHPVGDETLMKVGRCMQENLRDTDFVARIGGDEFALILPETRFADADTICEKMKSQLKYCKFSWSSTDRLQLTPSTGIACFPDDAQISRALIAAADNALYRLKKSL